jgi:CheY-like chemotaxis protein
MKSIRKTKKSGRRTDSNLYISFSFCKFSDKRFGKAENFINLVLPKTGNPLLPVASDAELARIGNPKWILHCIDLAFPINAIMKQTILTIDDERSIRLLLESFLSKNYEVTSKGNGEDALEWLETHLPDLIICDVQMPGMDGYAVLEHIRQRGYTKHTPVVMLSGVESSKERVKCYRLGAQDFLAKPFNPEELDEVIRKNLFPVHYALKW